MAKAEGKDTTAWEKHLAELEKEKAMQEKVFQYLCNRVADFNYNGFLG